MNPIVKIVTTFEYLINGWRITLVYANGKEFNYSDAQFESNIKNQLAERLSDISSDWLGFSEKHDDDFEIDYDNIEDYIDEEVIKERILNYFSLNKNSVSIEFRFSSDS